MLRLTAHKGKKTASTVQSQAVSFLTNPLTYDSEPSNPNPDPAARLEGLRRQFLQYGLNLYQLNEGGELALTGPGATGTALPDIRCAALLLRRLRGGAHG